MGLTPAVDRTSGVRPMGLTPAFGLFAGAARRPDDHEQLARAGAARKRLRLDAELFREPQRHALAPRREVHRRLRIAEVRRAADFLDRVPEAADMAPPPPPPLCV